MSETLDLKSKHLWRLVETFTKPKDENEDDEEDARDSNTPDWVARAMLEDLQMLSADHAALVARVAELEGKLKDAEWRLEYTNHLADREIAELKGAHHE